MEVFFSKALDGGAIWVEVRQGRRIEIRGQIDFGIPDPKLFAYAPSVGFDRVLGDVEQPSDVLGAESMLNHGRYPRLC